MMRYLLVILTALSLLTACDSQHTLTKEEMAVQNQASVAVSEILFDSGLDTKASYNVRKDGHVEIEFVKNVSMIDYTLAVEKMRKNSSIKSVYAVQSGSEVCPLK